MWPRGATELFGCQPGQLCIRVVITRPAGHYAPIPGGVGVTPMRYGQKPYFFFCTVHK